MITITLHLWMLPLAALIALWSWALLGAKDFYDLHTTVTAALIGTILISVISLAYYLGDKT